MEKVKEIFIDGDHSYEGVKYDVIEIISSPNQTWAGIGLILMK